MESPKISKFPEVKVQLKILCDSCKDLFLRSDAIGRQSQECFRFAESWITDQVVPQPNGFKITCPLCFVPFKISKSWAKRQSINWLRSGQLTVKIYLRTKYYSDFQCSTLLYYEGWGQNQKEPTMRGYLELYITDSLITPPYSVFPRERHRPPTATSSIAIQNIKGCLHNCTTGHLLCGTVSPSKLPKRVIHVGTQLREPSLYEPRPEERGQYICLSYCWGSSGVPLTTTTVSLPSRKHQIPLKSMPQTFQQAIEFTRALGYRYIWIDALCIIQDDIEDWERESSKMAEIYENSVLTLAVVHSKDSEGGLIKANIDQAHLGVKAVESDGTPVTIWSRQADCVFTDQLGTFASRPNTVSPLFDRAWTFQECLLPPRTVLFTDYESVWYCREKLQRPVHDRPTPCHTLMKQQIANILAKAQENNTISQTPKSSVLELWIEVVSAYSKRQLTLRKDKLPALSALACKFSHAFSCRYLAGLWDDDKTLAYQLSWFGEPCGLPECFCRVCLQKNYRAPSWSWASVNGEVSWESNYESFDSKITVIDIDSTAGLDPFGQVSSGSLTLEAYLIPFVDFTATTFPPGRYSVTDQIKPNERACFNNVRYFSQHHSEPVSESSTMANRDGIEKPKLTSLYIMLLGTVNIEGTSELEEEVYLLLAPEPFNPTRVSREHRTFLRVSLEHGQRQQRRESPHRAMKREIITLL